MVRGHKITVTSIASKGEASIKAPKGDGTHKVVDIKPLLAGGMPEADALQFVIGLVVIGIEGAEVQNG